MREASSRARPTSTTARAYAEKDKEREREKKKVDDGMDGAKKNSLSYFFFILSHTTRTLWHHWVMMYRRSRRWRTEKRARARARFLNKQEGERDGGGGRGRGAREKTIPPSSPPLLFSYRSASSRPRPTSALSPSSVARQASMDAPATSARSTRRREPARAALSSASEGGGTLAEAIFVVHEARRPRCVLSTHPVRQPGRRGVCLAG